jgi:hypothetical protein
MGLDVLLVSLPSITVRAGMFEGHSLVVRER